MEVSTPRSSGSSISPSTSSSSSTGSAKSAVSECLGAWLSYLQLLNNLVASGYRLTQCISTLESYANQHESSACAASQTTYQILSAWDELAKATNTATATVKSHIVSKLQDFITQPISTFEHEDQLQRARELNQYLVHDSFQTLVNLQHQFSVASTEFFVQCIFQSGYPCETAGLVKTDNLLTTASERFGSGSTTSDHCGQFEQIRVPSPIQGMMDHIPRGPLPNPGHLLTMKTPFYRGSRSPLNFPLFPSSGQRRWSETAAVQSQPIQEDDNQARRWSMPWENKTDKHRPISKLASVGPIQAPPIGHNPKSNVPSGTSGDRSQSIPSDSSVDGLSEAIQLLSCKPIQQRPMNTNFMHPPFIEEPSGMYGIWTVPQPSFVPPPNLRCFMKDDSKQFDDNNPPQP